MSHLFSTLCNGTLHEGNIYIKWVVNWIEFIINSLIPKGTWSYFCLDNVAYHNHLITILYDQRGKHYGKGKGLQIFCDGKKIASANKLGRLTSKLPPLDLQYDAQTSGAWQKYENNPVLGGDLGTCFDVSLLKEEDKFRMWFSWRPKKSVALVESSDGIHWGEPVIVLGPNPKTDWEHDINRPIVVKRSDGYHMWYTGQARGHSCIGYAKSSNGRDWNRVSNKPVISPDSDWEKVAVMCPHVIWDEKARLFHIWYSGGEQYEPDAVGYATSSDGIYWKKLLTNPIFRSNPSMAWEKCKVAACQVIKHGGWYYMFYVGFHDIHLAQIGIARSRDGINSWERHPSNPIIRPSKKDWDRDACYKPFVIYDNQQWMLWYNGRRSQVEQIGLAIHKGEDLGF